MTLKSTIVRLSQRIKMAAIRTLFGTLERAAPGLGAWWAERLWITMPRFRGARRPNTLPLGETFTVQVGGRRVRGRAWGSGPVVYLVHGWGGAGIQLDAFVGPLLAGGYRVVMFDALSHGESDPGRLGPRRSAVPELAEALTAVVAEHGRAHAVIAHSLGGTAVCYALRHGLPADRLVFLAPLTRPTPYARLSPFRDLDLAATICVGTAILFAFLQRHRFHLLSF
jgi:pimeloyl-ACP methyl ester carboxylesterase